MTKTNQSTSTACLCHCHVDDTKCGCCCGGCRYEVTRCEHCKPDTTQGDDRPVERESEKTRSTGDDRLREQIIQILFWNWDKRDDTNREVVDKLYTLFQSERTRAKEEVIDNCLDLIITAWNSKIKLEERNKAVLRALNELKQSLNEEGKDES